MSKGSVLIGKTDDDRVREVQLLEEKNVRGISYSGRFQRI
jgi:hypothetical protein